MSADDAGDLAPLVAGAAALGLALDAAQAQRFARYRALLLDWNSRVNLTAIIDPAEIVTRHFLDSLTCVLGLAVGWHDRALALLDVGSGAGFPGLALAIARPAWGVTLLEATGKKVRFLEAVIADLGLTNARALAGRAEEVARQPAYRARFDVVTARAVAALPTLLEYCAPFVRVGGRVIAPKKGDLADEIAQGRRAAQILGARLLEPVMVRLPGMTGMTELADGRVLLVAEQERACPSHYPRPAGAPAKRPLGA